jgi:MGT family glycosyltransferase
MSNFLITAWEGGGNLPPILKVASSLERAGHRVRVMSDACNRPEVVASGATFVAWVTAHSRPDKRPNSDPHKDWTVPSSEALRFFVERVIVGPSALYASDVIAELKREPADLVVSSDVLCGVIAACESVAQPVAVLTTNISLLPLPGVPPLGMGLGLARSGDDRAQHAAIAAFTAEIFDSALPQLNQLRADLGLPPLKHLYGQWAANAAILIGTSTAFDFPSTSLPANTRYVGPLLSSPSWAEQWQSLWPADDPRPLVLVGFSTTFQDHVALLQRVVNALARLSVRVVVTLGPALASDAIQAAPNTQIVASAPHDQIMREAALVVTHGGHGTVIQSLALGVPLLVIPLGRDQYDNAARVTARGAGLRLERDAGLDEIADAAARLLAELHFRDNARQLAAAVSRDAERACLQVISELEALAEKPAFLPSAPC